MHYLGDMGSSPVRSQGPTMKIKRQLHKSLFSSVGCVFDFINFLFQCKKTNMENEACQFWFFENKLEAKN